MGFAAPWCATVCQVGGARAGGGDESDAFHPDVAAAGNTRCCDRAQLSFRRNRVDGAAAFAGRHELAAEGTENRAGPRRSRPPGVQRPCRSALTAPRQSMAETCVLSGPTGPMTNRRCPNPPTVSRAMPLKVLTPVTVARCDTLPVALILVVPGGRRVRSSARTSSRAKLQPVPSTATLGDSAM